MQKKDELTDEQLLQQSDKVKNYTEILLAVSPKPEILAEFTAYVLKRFYKEMKEIENA